MNERLEYQQLECYKLANDMQKEKLNREPYFDLENYRENSFRQNLPSTYITGEHRYPF